MKTAPWSAAAATPPTASFNGRAPVSVTFFWDYDTQWGGDRSRSAAGPRRYGDLEFRNTELLLQILDDYHLRSCFAVVGAAAMRGSRPYHDPAQVRRIHQAGHEIASHSFKHEWLPALSTKDLRTTLRCSKDALEQCTGEEVKTFVPPFNQPFDCPSRLSFSLSERREVRTDRTDLARLCAEARDADYKLCRVSYRSLPGRVMDRLSGKRSERPGRLEEINGMTCLRLNTPGGFGAATTEPINRHINKPGIWVVYAHPHSALEDGPQSISCLKEFLIRLNQWRQNGLVRCIRPRDLLSPMAESGKDVCLPGRSSEFTTSA